MIRLLIILPLSILAIIVAISLYLQPNDLAGCNDQVSSSGSCQPVDAIVVISGGDTNARTDEAIRLYKNGWAPKLILSGAAEDKTGLSNAAAMKIRAVQADVPITAISLDESSESTKENAENVKTIFDNLYIKKVVLVTSGYHQRRASLEFNKYASDVTILNHPVASDEDWSWSWWTNPRGWTLATTEISKIVLFNFGVGQ